MPDPLSRATPAPDPATSRTPSLTPRPNPQAKSDAFLCERCGEEMFRMHAVWRCPSCGFKTDCCGW